MKLVALVRFMNKVLQNLNISLDESQHDNICHVWDDSSSRDVLGTTDIPLLRRVKEANTSRAVPLI